MHRKPKANHLQLRKAFARARIQFSQEIQELRDPAHSAAKLAAAFALGTLLSFIPVPVLDTILVGMILARFKQVNRAPLFMARLIWNDFLVFPLFGPGYKLGSALLESLMGIDTELPAGVDMAVNPLLSFMLGGVILAVSLTLLGYFAFLLAIKLYRAWSCGLQIMHIQ